jgi:hypothetical protein
MGPVALKPFLLIALDRAGNQEPAPNHPLQYLAYSSGERGLDKRYPIEPRNQGADFQPATTLAGAVRLAHFRRCLPRARR